MEIASLFRIITVISAIVILVAQTGCEQPNKNGKVVDSQGTEWSVIEIDSCEYIYNNITLAHKGNCKYCEQRRKEERQ